MTKESTIFERLRADGVYLEGVLASDVRSLWRRLLRVDSVQKVQRSLASDHDRIRSLCSYLSDLVEQPHDGLYRHPEDIAVCAGLALISQSPLSPARELIARLKRRDEPSLVWIKRMAEFCAESGPDNFYYAHGRGPATLQGDHFAATVSSSPQANDCLQFVFVATSADGFVSVDLKDLDQDSGACYSSPVPVGGEYA